MKKFMMLVMLVLTLGLTSCATCNKDKTACSQTCHEKCKSEGKDCSKECHNGKCPLNMENQAEMKAGEREGDWKETRDQEMMEMKERKDEMKANKKMRKNKRNFRKEERRDGRR